MALTLDRSTRWIAGIVTLATLVALALAGTARAATYPVAGGNTFTGSAEGWQIKSATCSIPVFCTADGGYDGASGTPAGSLATNSNVLVNLVSLFKTNVALESPEFKVGDGGSGTLSISRQFDPGGLLGLAPQATYSFSVFDKTASVESNAVTETITAASPFTTKAAGVPLVAGHTYVIKAVAEADSTLVGVGILGSTSLRFDNITLTGPGTNDGGGGGGGGGNGGTLTNASLTTLMQSSLIGPAVLKGKRTFIKAKCPAKVGRACKVSVQGLLKKGKPATSKRTVKIAKGKTKQLVLRVKPNSRTQVAAKKKLLFKQTVKAGKAKATVYKQLKLIKR